jgi:hypothetical protein
MTVKELKEKLSQYPDNMDVFVAERKTEFAYGLVNSVRSDEINFIEDPDDEEALARDTVVILDEE